MKTYLVKLPFNGVIQSEILPGGTVAYSGYLYNNGGDNLTVEEYLKLNPGYTVVNDCELDTMIILHEKTLVTGFKEIDSERFWYALDCLPPCKWGTRAGVEMFHVSERVTGDLVNWFFNVGGRYFEKVDFAGADRDLLATNLNSLVDVKISSTNANKKQYSCVRVYVDGVKLSELRVNKHSPLKYLRTLTASKKRVQLHNDLYGRCTKEQMEYILKTVFPRI